MTLPKHWPHCARCGRDPSTYWVYRYGGRREPVCLPCRGGRARTRRDRTPDGTAGQFEASP